MELSCQNLRFPQKISQILEYAQFYFTHTFSETTRQSSTIDSTSKDRFPPVENHNATAPLQRRSVQAAVVQRNSCPAACAPSSRAVRQPNTRPPSKVRMGSRLTAANASEAAAKKSSRSSPPPRRCSRRRAAAAEIRLAAGPGSGDYRLFPIGEQPPL